MLTTHHLIGMCHAHHWFSPKICGLLFFLILGNDVQYRFASVEGPSYCCGIHEVQRYAIRDVWKSGILLLEYYITYIGCHKLGFLSI